VATAPAAQDRTTAARGVEGDAAAGAAPARDHDHHARDERENAAAGDDVRHPSSPSSPMDGGRRAGMVR
jgi:hypothetical protein